MNVVHQQAAAEQQGLGSGSALTLVERVAKAVTDFNNQLSSAQTGALSQVWLPEVGEDGSIVLNTQGLPYAINGAGDLLALFRCISCKYKFSTDLTKPQFMGSVGRVFTSGEPEMSHNVQQYDKSVFLRAAEAQRCRISSAMFMPLFNSSKRDCVLGVFEVVQTDRDVLFPAVVDWLRCCLREMGLFTADVDKHVYVAGLRQMPPEYNVSAFESGTAAVKQQQRNAGIAGGIGAREAVGGMGPPQWQPLPTAQLGTQHAADHGVVLVEGENEVLVPRPSTEEKRPARLQARPSVSDPTSKKTTTGSAGNAVRVVCAHEAPAATPAQLKVNVEDPGDTLMGSTGLVAMKGKATDLAAEELPPPPPQEPPAAPAKPQEGGVLPALGCAEEEDEEEVLQPAKVAKTGEHPTSSLLPGSKEDGEGVRTPATAGTLEGVGRAGHPSGDPTNSPPEQRAGQVGSLLHPSSAACGSGGVDQALARPDAPTAAPAAAPAVGQPGNDYGAAGLPPVAVTAAAARMERVGTSGQLMDLEKQGQGAKGGTMWRSSSAPPIGEAGGGGTEPALPGQPFGGKASGDPSGLGGKQGNLNVQGAPALDCSAHTEHPTLPHGQQRVPQPPAMPILPSHLQPRTFRADTPRPAFQAGPPPALLQQGLGNGTGQLNVGLARSASGFNQSGAPALHPRASPAGIDPMRLMGSAAGRLADGAGHQAGGSMAPHDLARIPSGGVGQKNLTIEDLQPHFGYGLKEAAARLGICPTTLKRTCRRLGISRWPRRQLVRLTKQAAAAVKLTLDDSIHHLPSASDGSGGGEWAQQQPGVQLAFGPTGTAALATPSPHCTSLLPSNASLLLALQQVQQQSGAGGSAEGGTLPGSAAALVASPSLHHQLLQLQQQQQQQQQFQGSRMGMHAQGGYGDLPINAAKLAQLQQQLVAAAAAGEVQGSANGAPRAGLPPLPPGSGPLPCSMPTFVRSTPLGGASQPEVGGGHELFRPQPLALKGLAQRGQAQEWEEQQQQPPAGSRGYAPEAAGPPYALFGNTGGSQGGGSSFGQGHFSQQPRQRLQSGHDSQGGASFSGLGASPWQLPPRHGGGSDAHTSGRGDANQYVELAAAAAAANMQHHLAGGYGGHLPRKHPSPSGPHTGLSLGSLHHLGGEFHTGGRSIESLDILAAADFDSVANSPRGVSHLGGLSNLGLSNFGMSNLDVPAGANGLEFSVGGPVAGGTSSQRP